MPLEALKQRGSRQGSWRSLLPILHEEECFTPEDDASEHTHSFGPKALPSALISGADPRPVIQRGVLCGPLGDRVGIQGILWILLPKGGLWGTGFLFPGVGGGGNFHRCGSVSESES